MFILVSILSPVPASFLCYLTFFDSPGNFVNLLFYISRRICWNEYSRFFIILFAFRDTKYLAHLRCVNLVEVFVYEIKIAFYSLLKMCITFFIICSSKTLSLFDRFTSFSNYLQKHFLYFYNI